MHKRYLFKEDFKILEVKKEEKRKSNKIALFNYLNEELDEIENVPRNISPNRFNLDFSDNTIIHSSFSCNHDRASNIHHRNVDIINNYVNSFC